jgi:hypothetical protein
MSVDDTHTREPKKEVVSGDREQVATHRVAMSATEAQTTNGKRDGSVAVHEQVRGSVVITIKRAATAAATAFLSVNLFTGAPLLALWAGSQASADTILSMKAVAVVIVVYAVVAVGSAFALTWLSNTYDVIIGRPVGERRASWLRDKSARGFMSSRVGETLLERIVISSVYVAMIGLLIWFFFFAHASL